MPPLSYLLIGTIAVIVLMTAELVYGQLRRRRLYSLGDTLTNLSGIGFEHVFMVLVSVPVYVIYTAAYRHRLWDGPPRWLAALIALPFVDLSFYAWHRLSHRVAVLWFGHAVHHSSEEFNVSVAVRASGWALLTQRFFFLPMAILGIPVELVVLADGFSNLYTLWVHTRAVGKLGILERIIITPSHHRVHHGRNPEYLDKNFGAIFIVWDRIFGTYAEETVPPVFGLREPFQSHNIVWARFFILVEIAGRIRRAHSLREALLAPFRPPEWDPDGNHDVGSPAVAHRPTKVVASGLARSYAVAQHVIVFAGVALFVVKGEAIGVGARLALAAWLWASLGVAGALLDARRWAVKAEAVRWAVALAGVAVFLCT
jgi:sterol desaturase/sphingolipid hydroxylase (fatty acid hydroxylase superfamily)